MGDTSVGKTCLVTRLCEDKFVEEHDATVGLDLKVIKMKLDNKIIKVPLYDYAGNKMFEAMMGIWLKTEKFVLLCYDETSSESL